MARHRKSRVDTIELFLRSGDPVWLIEVEEHELYHNVQFALYKAITSRPYFTKRCECFSRRGKVFLVRKDDKCQTES